MRSDLSNDLPDLPLQIVAQTEKMTSNGIGRSLTRRHLNGRRKLGQMAEGVKSMNEFGLF